jgi:hypothetical protein
VVPYALKVLLGVDNFVTLDGINFLNSTFLVSVTALTFLIMDPLLKSAYVLRCFDGQAQESGQDLLVKFRSMLRSTVVTAALLLCCGGSGLSAQDTPPPPVSSEDWLNPHHLDQQIKTVLDRDEFAWRLPRIEVDSEKSGLFSSFFANIDAWLIKVLSPWKAATERFFEWLSQTLGIWLKHLGWHAPPAGDEGVKKEGRLTEFIAIVVGSGLLLFLMWLIMQSWRKRPRKVVTLPSISVQIRPDLQSESTLATALPVNEWLQLAQELHQRGELRLALRAYYLASLAYLAEAHLITVLLSKSNHDYLREVSRRGQKTPRMLALFQTNIELFERGWYGNHLVDHTWIEEISRNHREMTSLQ